MADLNEEQLIKKQKILESGLDIAEETVDKLITAEDSQLAIDEYIQGKYQKNIELAQETESTTTQMTNQEALNMYGIDLELAVK